MAQATAEQNLAKENTSSTKTRLIFIDVVRGLTIAFMILVNNNGNERLAYWPLKHADWNGWTPTDLVFPTFLLLVGITIVLSTASRVERGESKASLLAHAFQRAAILFILGIAIHGFPHYPLTTLRIYGVLQRIALCYLVTTILYVWDRRVVTLAITSAFLLLGYWVLMRWVPIPGHGIPGRDFPFLDKDINWVSVVDRSLFPGRLLEKTRDPLGLISTIPAIATCLIGVLTGIWLRSVRNMYEKAGGLLGAAAVFLLLGSLAAIWFPINKRLWTSSYVLFSAGWTLLLLCVSYYLIDIRKHQGRLTYPWKVFGSNAIFAYAFSELLAITLEVIRVGDEPNRASLKVVATERVFSHISNPSLASLAYSLVYVAICFIPCLILYRKRIFLKV